MDFWTSSRKNRAGRGLKVLNPCLFIKMEKAQAPFCHTYLWVGGRAAVQLRVSCMVEAVPTLLHVRMIMRSNIYHTRADLLKACKQSSAGTGREEILRGSTCCSSLAGSRLGTGCQQPQMLTSACMQPGGPCGSVSRCQRKKKIKKFCLNPCLFGVQER